MSQRTPADNQLAKRATQKAESDVVRTSSGNPIGNREASLSVGERGPLLWQDTNLLDELAHFSRERIPERVVHAKGAGAFGYFEVTHDVSKYTAARVFDTIGKRTQIAVRFSTVGGESGSADTARDPRGFAVKFYTEDGIWDMVGNNTPIFFIRDPILFPSFIHTQKRNPTTHLKDPDMLWDFMTLRPETCHQTMFLFSDRGTPDGYRFMNGYASHTFKLINAKQEPVYCKFHYKTNQGIKNLSAAKADELAGSDPDYAIRDLYNAIANGQFPQYNLSIQVMTFAEAEKFKFNPFDLTKVWPHGQFPLIPVGRLVLDRNPENYFAEVEQIAFSPNHLIPGIAPSPDKMLQGRLFAYSDTHRHRLGANYLQLPVNCPYKISVKNYQRDGPMNVTNNQGGAPNYYPNSFGGPESDPRTLKLEPPFKISGDVYRVNDVDLEDNYAQPADFWNNVLTIDERKRLVENMSSHLINASAFIQERAVKNFSNVSQSFGDMLTVALQLKRSSKM